MDSLVFASHSLQLASLLVALVATAGAIPLFRNVFLRWNVRTNAPTGGAAASPVAGIAMVFGVVLSMFYVESSPVQAPDYFAAIAVLIMAGFWMEWRDVFLGREFWFELGGSAVAGLALCLPLLRPSAALTGVGVVLLVMAVATPMAVSLLRRSPRATPALPTGIVLVQLLMLALLGAMGANTEATSSRYQEFMTVALPIIGAAIGALIYLCRMPWRTEAAVSTGVAARLCLGLTVVWGVTRLGTGLDDSDQRMAALIWILAVPICECLREYAVSGLRIVPLNFRILTDPRSLLRLDHSPAAICIFALIFGGIGIGLCRLRLPVGWSIALLLPALFAYWITPILLHTWTKFHQSRIVDARS